MRNQTLYYILALIVFLSFFATFQIMVLPKNQPVTIKDVYQYVDEDAQIVCYILKNGSGISCLPLSEVNISE